MCYKCRKFFSSKSSLKRHLNRKTSCLTIDISEEIVEIDENPPTHVNLSNKTQNKIKLLSLFSGIGGMDAGFDGEVIVHRDSIANKDFIDHEHTTKDFVALKKQNFECVFQNDILGGAKEVFGYNNDNSNYNTTSIYNLISENFTFPQSDVVIGGFPCQDFSHSGKRKGFESTKGHDLREKVIPLKENSRGTLYKSFVEVVKKVKPKIFVAENVYGLLTMKNEPIKQIMKDFSVLGYDVSYQIIYCPDFGIPQTRKRVIIIGISKDRTTGIEKDRTTGIEKDRTTGIEKDWTTGIEKDWNVITENKIECCIGKYFEHLQEPEVSTDVSQKVYSKAKKLKKGQGQKEVDLNSFAPTMRAEHHGNIEFRRHENSTINIQEKHLKERRLTVREAGLIQTFSPDYIFSQKLNMVAYKYIGNAVPPLLGYLIANKVEKLYKKHFVTRYSDFSPGTMCKANSERMHHK